MSDEYRKEQWPRRRAKVGVLFCLALITHHSSLITVDAKQPQFGEPLEHYYKAKGRGLSVRWEVKSPTVRVGSNLTATLVIIGATNPTEVEKPDLRKLKAFDAFKITDTADPPRDPKAKEVRFVYTISPRNTSVTEVPSLRFYYFNQAAAEGKRFPYTVADSVPITVTEPPPKPPVPLVEADGLFHVATGADVLSGPFVPCWWGWGAAALFGPLVAVAWFLVWRRVYPDAARMARLRRSRSARRATDAIRRSGRAADPPAVIASAVLAYLRTRFPLPESAVTPSEIATALCEAQVPADIAEETADVFRGCDRARFAPPGDSGASLATDAEATITRLEALA